MKYNKKDLDLQLTNKGVRVQNQNNWRIEGYECRDVAWIIMGPLHGHEQHLDEKCKIEVGEALQSQLIKSLKSSKMILN